METGVLLPISALPDGKFFPYGPKFVDWLARNNYKYWQVLPLSPRDSFGSPYNSPNSMRIDRGYGAETEWFKLKKYANMKGIRIIGDVGYFITKTEKDGLFVKGFFAGAPPDDYSRKGQYWGLPIFDWEHKYNENLAYLLKRLRRAFDLFDIIRLDHFRGYCAVWAVPVPYKTGRRGTWRPVPGDKIMTQVRKEFPKQLFIAENLGLITPDVERLRRKFKALGTKMMVFGATPAENDEVFYSSNHDTRGMIGRIGRIRRIGEGSGAKIFIMPMWDILGLGRNFRFNKPGKKGGNWQWRLDKIEE